MGYTWVQFTAYREMARRRLARQQRDLLTVVNRAFAGGKSADELRKALHTESEG